MFANVYNRKYWLRYLKQSKSELGQKIYQERWKIISRYLDKGTLLDYGCGPGAFNAAGGDEFQKFGYDINPHCGFKYYPDHEWDAVTFWDSLEHIPNFYSLIRTLNPKWLFIATPNLESVRHDVLKWKHYRPDEHIYYFDRHSLKIILKSLGYFIREINFTEGQLRDPQQPEAVMTVVAEKVDHASISKE